MTFLFFRAAQQLMVMLTQLKTLKLDSEAEVLNCFYVRMIIRMHSLRKEFE